MKKKPELNNIVFSVIAIALSTLYAIAFEGFNFRAENIMLIYVGTIMLIMVHTKKNVYGLSSTFLLVFIFNFLFTEPKYTFKINDPNYIITLIIFTLVSVTMGTLTNQLQKEILVSKDNEKKLEQLYIASQSLLNAKNKREIILKTKDNLSELMLIPIHFYFCNSYFIDKNDKFDFLIYENKIEFAIENNMICGKDELKYNEIPIKIFPFSSNKGFRGALIFECTDKKLSKQEREFAQTSILHMITALERELMATEEENTRIEMEKERIKSALLRSISHDLRTPLTSLKTGTSLLYDSYDVIDEDIKKSMLLDINNETSRLNDFVENLLNMTRLTANKFSIKKNFETIDDILTDVHRRVKNRLLRHNIIIKRSKEINKINVDGQLITQVFINLIDNAIRHTGDESLIKIDYDIDKDKVVFRVIDNGGGIQEKNIGKIFENFTSIETKKEDNFRGIGLGLSICKAIVNAHGGDIIAYNNDIGGATFEFYIPQKSR
jgi:two-component system sensor histidine kinase KdpD